MSQDVLDHSSILINTSGFKDVHSTIWIKKFKVSHLKRPSIGSTEILHCSSHETTRLITLKSCARCTEYFISSKDDFCSFLFIYLNQGQYRHQFNTEIFECFPCINFKCSSVMYVYFCYKSSKNDENGTWNSLYIHLWIGHLFVPILAHKTQQHIYW